VGDEQAVDLSLLCVVVSGALADVDDFRLRPGPVEEGAVGQFVVHNHLRLGDEIAPAQGDQARVAGAGANQKHARGGERS